MSEMEETADHILVIGRGRLIADTISAGVVTVIPPFAGLGALFGIGQLLWFVWIGVVLVRLPRLATPG